jgi:Xaa-Pro aminopeptidase
MRRGAAPLAARVLALAAPLALAPPAPAQPDRAPPGEARREEARPDDAAARPEPRMDVEAARALLAVQGLDGWLLAQSGGLNPIATELVAPAGATTHTWFYFVPARGETVALAHQSEVGAFQGLAGRVLEYTDERGLKAGLRGMLRGSRRIAMEYAPRSGIPSLTRVDPATVALVRGARVKITSSAELVQFTKSLWGPEGRVAHYLAAHHLVRLKDAALAHLAAELRARHPVTEQDLQRFLQRGFEARGLDGPPPVVAAGANTAEPEYATASGRSDAIQRGDLVLLDLAARVTDSPRPIYARLSWVAYVGAQVPARHADVFRTVAAARDAAIELIQERVSRRRAVKGFEADRKARAVVTRAGLGEKFSQRTGHSLDTSLYGDGANLDDRESHDTRALVMGSGFTVGPGVYLRGDFGMRSIVGVYLGRKGLEVTSPAQKTITAVPAP